MAISATNPLGLQIIVKGTSKKGKLDKHIRSYIREYLDETQKTYIERTLRPMDKPSLPQIRGVDYHSHHAQGLVTVHGYLSRYVLETSGKMPEDLKREELIPALSSAIHTAAVRLGRAKAGSKAVCKFAFSLSPEMSAAWKAAGIDTDAGLRHIVRETMERYRLGVMDGSEVGYAVGIHHDRAHLHAHVLLMLHSENGKHLKLSNRHQVTLPDGSVRRIDHLTLLTNTANMVLREFQEKLTTPSVAIGNKNDYGPDLQRWLTLAACDLVPKEIKGAEAEVRRVQERDRLRAAPAREIVQSIDNAYRKRLALFRQCQNAALSSEGRDKLTAAEIRYRDLIAQYLNASRDMASQQRKARKEKIALLKAQQTELQILAKIAKLTKSKLTKTGLVFIREIQDEMAKATFSDPTIGRLVAERLAIAQRRAGPTNAPMRLADQLNRKNLNQWRDALTRQYAEAKVAANKKISEVDLVNNACTIHLENLRTNLDIYKCARELRVPTWLERYNKLRTDKGTDLEAHFGPALGHTGGAKTKPHGISLRI